MSMPSFHKSVIFSFLVIPILVSISCNTPTLIIPVPKYAAPNDMRKLFPIRAGMKFTYRSIQWTDVGGFAETTTVTRTVNYVNSDSGNIWAEVADEISDSNGASVDGSYWAIDSSSYRRVPEATWYYVPLTLCQIPIIKGRSWHVSQNDFEYNWWYGDLLYTSVDTTVYVLGKKYEHCIMIDPDYSLDYMFSWYLVIAPGIGIVREWVSAGVCGRSLELISKNF